MSAARLLVTCGHLQRHVQRYRAALEAEGIELFVPPLTAQQFTADEMKRFIADVDAVIAGDDVIDRDVLETGKSGRLKAVIKWGIGTDGIDKKTARELGLPVYNTPGAFSEEVADLALGIVIGLARSIPKIDSEVRRGGWPRYEGMSMTGKTVGIIGLGGIGQAIAVRCRAFGMTIVGSDVVQLPEHKARELAVTQMSVDELLPVCDIVILACNLTPDNRHLIDAAAIQRMKPGSLLVNVARGPLVEEQAVVAALRSGHLAGAGLDVFEVEPLPSDSPLRDFDNCIFGTHGGSSTVEAIDRINDKTIEIARCVLGRGSSDMSKFNRVV